MCRLKKHAYTELSPHENHVSQAKSLHPSMRNSVFPRALFNIIKLPTYVYDMCFSMIFRSHVR